MKKINRTVASMIILLGGAAFLYGQPQALRTVRIMGKTFYCYETKKGETLDDIAQEYGWEKSTLERINPEAGEKPDAGTMIFYPIGARSEAPKEPSEAPKEAPEVPKEAPKEIPAPAEEVKTEPIPQQEYIFHTVGHNESLYGIARQHDTTIEEIFRVNPGLGAGTLREGIIIRIPADAKPPERYKEIVKEPQLAAVTSYKVKRGDSWGSIAEAFALTEETLKEANPGVDQLAKGMTINIPVINEVEVEKEFVAEDPREKNEEGLQELYNEVHSLTDGDKDRFSINETPTVGVAVVLTDVGKTADEKRSKQNKEMEFARGAITAVDAMKLEDFKTRLTVLDGSLPEEDIVSALDEFNPTIIISTSDTSLPEYLTNYISDKQVLLVNAFDAQNQVYVDNPKVVQYLVPTSYMNDEITDYFAKTFGDYKLLVAGTPDSKDALGNCIIGAFAKMGAGKVEELDIAALPETVLDDGEGKYLIYGTPTTSKDVKALLEKIGELRTRNILANIKVVGRPNWVPYTSSLGQLMGENYVYIPSRFFFDPEDRATKDFIEHYESLFKLRPMKAAPVYCATSYDILTYFVPNLAHSKGDFNATYTAYPTLQSPMGLDRVSSWGGIVNKGVYVLSFTPYGGVERIMLPTQ